MLTVVMVNLVGMALIGAIIWWFWLAGSRGGPEKKN